MRNDRIRDTRKETPEDIGTLWSMRHGEHLARCALLVLNGGWELRVLVDGTTLLAETCEGPAAAFVLAARWKDQMIGQGWRQILPPSGYRRSLDERSPA